MTHQITEDELTEYIQGQRHEWRSFAVSTGVGTEVKRLEFCVGEVAPLYRVTRGGRTTYIGALKETAVREYNALP